MIIIQIILNNLCQDYDCHGFECKEITYPHLNITRAVCQCDKKIFSIDCQYCRNFRYSRESNCTQCIDGRLDPNNKCASCKDSTHLDIDQECTSCLDEKYDIKKKCNACTFKHMDFSKDCNSCEGNFILLVNECISKAFSNFTIYFGIIFSHLAIIAVLLLVWIQHKKKKIQQAAELLSE
ncbi:Growth_factor receptor cysteine-rich domain superfamily [Hexamita inflata]|uniref:Growth factor receptor cysteine-rich domain superfamily n=1 Tax=Hexamita inflata TaxID=28002 RepID=A0AA86NCB2_9EUKA|nr:Growth factor receptor cysteine-rich domain superfamily [Hexamita inflata]